MSVEGRRKEKEREDGHTTAPAATAAAVVAAVGAVTHHAKPNAPIPTPAHCAQPLWLFIVYYYIIIIIYVL